VPRRSPPTSRFGALLRSYAFKKYRTSRKSEDGVEDEPRDGLRRLTIQCAKPDAAAKAFTARKAIAEGVFLARDLVNEPANMLVRWSSPNVRASSPAPASRSRCSTRTSSQN